MKLTSLALLAALALAPSAARAAGFAVDTHGGRATGMATAVTSHVADPSAIFYNPAGLAQTEELELLAGDTLIVPSLTYTSSATGVSTTNNFAVSPPPHLYATARLGETLAAGVGLFTAYGSAASWPGDWEHRFRSLRSAVSTYFINPTVAWKPLPFVRVGAGVQLVRGTVLIERKLNFVDSEGTVQLGGGGWGLGANAGVQVDLLEERLQLGLAYRSNVNVRFEGRAHFGDVPAELATTLRDQPIRSALRTPDTASLGVSYRPLPQLLLAADLNWYRWSTVPAIVFDFEDPALRQSVPKRWHDVMNYHLGAEYQLTESFALRAGAMYDPTPSPTDTLTPDLPDANRVKGTVGVGYTHGRLSLDAGYQLILLRPATSSFPGYEGSYRGLGHVLGLSVGWRP